MKKILLILSCALVLLLFGACVIAPKNDDPQPSNSKEVIQVVRQLWTTDLKVHSTERLSSLSKIQGYADLCLAPYFKNYLYSFDATCEKMEQNDPILTYYRMAFDRVLADIRDQSVSQGKVKVWLLYNMGIVVKTNKQCFGIDINHRWATRMAPYLDFLCITHNHVDHYDNDLIKAMFDAGKPVLSNYLKKNEGYAYTSTTASSYSLGECSIRTGITDHNTSLKNFVTVFRIDCGPSSGNFSLLHVGDSNFVPSQYANVNGAVDLLVVRFAPNALTENNIIGSGKVEPRTLFLTHILELAHAGEAESRWSVNTALERLSKLNCAKSYMPFWGEYIEFESFKP